MLMRGPWSDFATAENSCANHGLLCAASAVGLVSWRRSLVATRDFWSRRLRFLDAKPAGEQALRDQLRSTRPEPERRADQAAVSRKVGVSGTKLTPTTILRRQF